MACADFGEDEVLRLAAGAERGSEHPLGEALVEAARGRGLTVPDATGFDSLPGAGVHAAVDGHDVWIGNAELARAHGFADVPEATLARHEDAGRTPLVMTVDGKPGAIFAVADTPKASAREAIRTLRARGLRTLLLSGDTQRTATAIARELGIDEARGGVKPAQKAEVIAELQRAGHRVAMVGDGVNDAPALARADLGIAIGSGTDVAIASAGVVLVGGDPRGVPRALRLSRATVNAIRQNLFWAFVYNVLLIPVAAGVFYPFTGWVLSPVLAAGAMALSSVTVVTNSLRLRSVSLD
jgi:Cu+-exporting ATPase